MNNKPLLSAIIIAAISFAVSAIITSCETIVSEPAPIELTDNSIATRSDVKGDWDEYNVTSSMAVAYAESFKDRTKIVSVEEYEYNGITCLYIINFEKGWMVIPADARVQPVLGDSEVENLYPEELENNGVIMWLDLSAKFVYYVKTQGRLEKEINPKVVALWDGIKKGLSGSSAKSLEPGDDPAWVKVVTVNTTTTVDANVPHLLETKWGQHYPWNTTLPFDPVILNLGYQQRFVTGCVPTAVSQVLYYFHNETGYPNDCWEQITPYISQSLGGGQYKLGLNRVSTSYRINSTHWDDMPLSQSDTGSFAHVSDLMMEVGVRMDATYSTNATGASMISASEVAPCGLTANAYYYSYSTVKSNLLNDKPVLVSAFNNTNGHSWVIDGCFDRTVSTVTTVVYYEYQPGVLYPTGAIYLTEAEALAECPGIYDGKTVITNNTVLTQYLLMNYGWDGQYDNGHYTIESTGSDWASNYNQYINILYSLVAGQMY